MLIENLPVSSLTPDPRNARRHDEAQIEALKKSLQTFGVQKPIVIDRDNIVVAGNGFLAAAIALGWQTIPCVRTNLTGEKARAFAIADNRIAELSDWDVDALAKIIETLPDGFVAATGWDQAELDAMLGRAIDSYKPVLTPEFADAPVTAEAVDRASEVFDVAQKRGAKAEITCPHCGEDFEIDPIS